jgi:hypothetical protein
MKKLLIVLGLIVVLIGATYGGVAFAGKPAGTSVVMEAISGGDYASDGSKYIVGDSYPYPEIKHVSLTLVVHPLDGAGDIVQVSASAVPAQSVVIYEVEGPTTERTLVTLEFNACSWSVQAWESGGDWALAQYAATITSPK